MKAENNVNGGKAESMSSALTSQQKQEQQQNEQAHLHTSLLEEGENEVSTNYLSPTSLERLRKEFKHALCRDKDTEELINVLAENNGWDVHNLPYALDKITLVELFLLNITRLPQLRFFPMLTTVKLMHIGLTSMTDVSTLINVEELWLCDNEIEEITGLEKLTKLRKLYLHNNHITSMNGLPVLKRLRELWLCCNDIHTICNLENVRKLRLLSLASNPIEKLTNSFSPSLTNLRELNVSGCVIYSLSEIRSLRCLPALTHLRCADALFGECPVVQLSNYKTCTLHLLPSLTMLDGVEVNNEEIQLAQSTYYKKRTYYSMRLHALQRNLSKLMNKCAECSLRKRVAARKAENQLRSYLSIIDHNFTEKRLYKHACLEYLELKDGINSNINNKHDENSSARWDDNALRALQTELSRAISTREVEIQRTLEKHNEAFFTACQNWDRLAERLCVELNTGGNIRYEEVPSHSSSSNSFTVPTTTTSSGSIEGNTNVTHKHNADRLLSKEDNDGWYSLARQFVQDRFHASHYRSVNSNITGVEVCRISRCVNKGLRLRFDARVNALHMDLHKERNRKNMVCLMSIVPPSSFMQSELLEQIIYNGMYPLQSEHTDNEESKQINNNNNSHSQLHNGKAKCKKENEMWYWPSLSEGVPLTNSLFIADEARLRECEKNNAIDGIHANGNALVGQVIVSRVILRKCVSVLGGGIASVGLTSMEANNYGNKNEIRPFAQPLERVCHSDYGDDVFAAYKVYKPRCNAAINSSTWSKVNSKNSKGRRKNEEITATKENVNEGEDDVEEDDDDDNDEGEEEQEEEEEEEELKVWYCFDRPLILPEFVVDFVYILRTPLLQSPSLTLCTSPHVLQTLITQYLLCEKTNNTRGEETSYSLSILETSKLGNVQLSAAAWSDLQLTAYSLVSFIQLCTLGGPFEEFAKRETCNLLTKAQETFSKIVSVDRNRCNESESYKANNNNNNYHDGEAAKENDDENEINNSRKEVPLSVEIIMEYKTTVECERIDQFIFCQLQRHQITCVDDTLETNLFSALRTLDLSFNSITHVSWLSIARAAPLLQILNLSHNKITLLEWNSCRLLSLQVLDLRYNRICNLFEACAEMLVCFPVLQTLHVDHNTCQCNNHKKNKNYCKNSNELSKEEKNEYEYEEECVSDESVIEEKELFARLGSSTQLVSINGISLDGFRRVSILRTLRARTLDMVDATSQLDTYNNTTITVNINNGEEIKLVRMAQDIAAIAYEQYHSARLWKRQADFCTLHDGVVCNRYFEHALESVMCANEIGLSETSKTCLSELNHNNYYDDLYSKTGATVNGTTNINNNTTNNKKNVKISSVADIKAFYYAHSLTSEVSWVHQLFALEHVTLRGHCIHDLLPFTHLRNLQLLDVHDNMIYSLPPSSALRALGSLTYLDISCNKLCSLTGLGVLTRLKICDASCNHLHSLFDAHEQNAETVEQQQEQEQKNNEHEVKSKHSLQGTHKTNTHSNNHIKKPNTKESKVNGVCCTASTTMTSSTLQTECKSVSLLACQALEELYVSYNYLYNIDEVYLLRELPTLLCIDLFNNPLMCQSSNKQNGSCNTHAETLSYAEQVAKCLPVTATTKNNNGCNEMTNTFQSNNSNTNTSCTSEDDVRLYIIYHLRQLKVLNGFPITMADVQEAEEVFSGKLSMDLYKEKIAQQIPMTQWSCQVVELDLSYCNLRELDNSLNMFKQLEILRLHHNQLTRLQQSSFVELVHLKALDLSYNKLNCMNCNNNSSNNNNTSEHVPFSLGYALMPLVKLESLSLEGNHILDLNDAHLRLANLKFLNMKCNDIQYIQHGCEFLPELREVHFARNKLHGFHTNCFAQCKRLSVINADENVLRSLEGLSLCNSLIEVSLASNRLADLNFVMHELEPCSMLQDLTLVGNALTRKSNYRTTVISHFSHLIRLDHKPITNDERNKAMVYQATEWVAPPNVFIDLSYLQNNNNNNSVGVRNSPALMQTAGQQLLASSSPPSLLSQRGSNIPSINPNYKYNGCNKNSNSNNNVVSLNNSVVYNRNNSLLPSAPLRLQALPANSAAIQRGVVGNNTINGNNNNSYRNGFQNSRNRVNINNNGNNAQGMNGSNMFSRTPRFAESSKK